MVGVGALISVAGSDESGMIGTARLGYALAADGLFPSLFAKIHRRFKTPYVSSRYSKRDGSCGSAFGAVFRGTKFAYFGFSIFS